MLFQFLSYLQPTHYFSIPRANGASVFPLVNEIPTTIKDQLDIRSYYQSTIARDYDLSWQAVQKGYIGESPTYTQFEPVPLSDDYAFIRTYFSGAWVLYVLVLRLLHFKNPITELRAFLGSKGIARSTYLQTPIIYPTWDRFESALVKAKPKVSVIIPTLNRYDYLKDVLHDLEQQDFANFEVIVVDQSEPFDKDFYISFNLNLQLIQQEEKALWLARNTAIKNSKGEFIAFSEDDVRIEADWISNHLKCLDFFDAQVSAGVFYPEGSSIPASRSFFLRASQFATGNAMLYKEVFKNIGLFDRQFEKQRMGDGEFGLRCYVKGIKSVSNPYASCVDVKAATGGLRHFGSWDAFRTSKLFAPRPIPSVLYFYRTYFGNKAAKMALLKTIPLSIIPYQFKTHKFLMAIGAVLSLLLLPVVFIQVFKSWRLSSTKLKEGPIIETLHG